LSRKKCPLDAFDADRPGAKIVCGWGFERSGKMEALKKSAKRRMVDHEDLKGCRPGGRQPLRRWWLCQRAFFPQQLPGPAQPAWAGELPQQAVSPGPGRPRLADPDRLDVAESNFFNFALPQLLQAGSVSDDVTSSSLIAPHSVHRNSKIGMTF